MLGLIIEAPAVKRRSEPSEAIDASKASDLVVLRLGGATVKLELPGENGEL
jgi:hypothetical protein